MATPHHHHKHHDQYVIDSEDTSDSNEEFASASEGDDDLPWEPVVIRSPIISRQSPISPALTSTQVQLETPRLAHATIAPTSATTTGTTTTIARNTSSSFSIATTSTTTTTSRTLTAPSSSFEHQYSQQQQQQQVGQHDFDQGHQEDYHYQQQSHESTPHHHPIHGEEQQWDQQQQQQQQWNSTSIHFDSSSPRTHHAHREFSSSSSSSTRSQGSPSQILRGAAPKLRERMRQSPVLHSRIVQAYLDPNASQAQRQQQQHASSENVRQAWLQDAHQESSEDDTEGEQEQAHHHAAPIRPTPTHAPIPVYHHPVVPSPVQVAPVPSFEALSPVDQHDTEHSWNEDEYEDQLRSDHRREEEPVWGFGDQIDIEGGAQSGEQVEEAWGFDESIEIDSGVQPHFQPAEPAVEVAWGFDDNIEVEKGIHSGEQQAEAAWGFDDDVQVGEKVQEQLHSAPAQEFSHAHIHEEIQPHVHHDETAWGFDDNLHMEETVQPDLHQVETAWGFDDNIDIEGGIQTADHPTEPIVDAEETTQLAETDYPDRHQEESAWGFDDNVRIEETTQPEHQTESAWGFDDTIDIVTSTAIQEHQHEESTASIEARASVGKSRTVSDNHVGASWGFEDKMEIGDTPQVEQIESSWGFDEPIVAEELASEHHLEQTETSATDVEPTYPAMHQAHESDADAWDYDDQTIELIEEAAVQEIHSASFTACQNNDLDHEDSQQSHTSQTDSSFSDHVVMPPSSTTPSADNCEDDRELTVVVDHTTTDEPNQLVQEQLSHANTTVSEPDNLHDFQRTVTEESYSVHSVGPSDVVEVTEAEQSWGFDMDEVIGDQDLETANPSLDGIGQEPYQAEDPHVVPSTADNTHDQVEQDSFVASTTEATQGVIEDIGTAPIVDETKHADQTSDDENDSEVKEVLFSTQYSPLANLEGAESSEISPFATSSRVHSGSSVSFDDNKPYYADAAVTSHLLVREDAAPSHRSDSRGSVGELKRSVSDSESSDIYGDLSTAYTGRNMSSNRLNEILDDDDYLEHMERGVPMDRSISTPFSDDETPKFVMEDDVVELMERGEPQPVSGVPTDHMETLDDDHGASLDDNQEASSDDSQDISSDGCQDASSDDNQATSSTSERAINISEGAASPDATLHTADGTVSLSLADAFAGTTTGSLSHRDETHAVVVEEEVGTPSARDAKVTASEGDEVSSAVETVVDAASDDRDPANPFSDAAAIDDTGLWSATEPLLELTEKEELSSEPLPEAPTQDSTIDTENFSHAIDEDLEDAWADQGLDVVVEPELDISTPSTAHAILDTLTDVKPEETRPVVEIIEEGIIDGLDGDAWGDQDLETVENSSTLERVIESSKHVLMNHQELPAVEHHETELETLAEPEQTLVKPIVGAQDAETAETGPFDNLEELADDDLSEQPAIENVIVEAKAPSPLPEGETSAVHAGVPSGSHHTHIPATPPKDTTLEVDTWENQTGALDLDAALEEDAWADQEDAPPVDIPAVPIAHAVVYEERSVSDLFSEKSDQNYKPSSPIRAFASTAVNADSPVRSYAASPARGFAAYSAYSPANPQQRPVSDLFSGKPEQHYEPTSPVRGFAKYAVYSHDTQEQDRSVSDLFPEASMQQPVKPSTHVPTVVSAEDNILKDAVEEDAWDDQDVHIAEEPLLLTSKSEPESEPEPVTTTASLEIEQSIDDALEGDAWGDDQDAQIHQEPMPAETGLHMDVPAAAIVKVQEIHGHITHTIEQTSKSYSAQETTHAFDIGQSVDASAEDDAWNNQDDDMTFESTLPSQPELEQGPQHDPLPIVPETSAVEVIVQQDTLKDHEPTIDVLTTDLSLEASFEEVASGNQDDTTLGQDFGTHHDQQFIGHVHAPVHLEDVVAEDNRPISALEVDMWADNDLPTFSEPSVKVQVQAAATPSPITGTHLPEDSPALNQPENPEDQPILPSFESPALPTPTDAEVDFELDKALEDDAWNDQTIDISLDSAEPAPTAQDTHVNDIPWSQDVEAEKSEEHHLSASTRIGSIKHQSHTKTAAEIVEDAWGWDEDEVGISLEIEKDDTPPSQNDSTILAQDDQDDGESKNPYSPVEAEEVVVVREETTPDAHSPAQAPTETPDNNLSPLAIQRERLTAGADSGEGDADSATQSPWQDISPASVSKRSEAGMSIGSEFESEYSVRSLDEDGHVSSAFDRHQPHGHETSAPSADSDAKVLETTSSWTDLRDDDAWDNDLPDIGPVNPPTDSEGPSVPAKEAIDNADAQQLPDISGADNWDFDQDDDLQSEPFSSFAGLTSASTGAGFSRSLKTPDMTESRSFGSQPSPQNKTPGFSSSITSSPGQVLSSYQSSMVGSAPASPSLATDSTAAPSATEVEDDSHLPVAIRQQRARLAARGKPLPPISKYKSTKEGAAVEQQSSPVLSSASPRLAAATTSPVISFASPAKTPLSPALNPATVADQKFLSPALQRQRERLEKKRATIAAAAATPLSTARRVAPSDSSLVDQLSSQAPVKPTSPLIKEAVIPSALKHTLSSPTSVRKSVHLVDRSETTTTSPSTFSVEEFGHSTRRRGLSVSSNQNTHVTSPLTPTGEGVVRRSKEGNRSSMFSSLSAATTPTSATFSEIGESNVVKSTQNDAFRHVSRLSMSSSTGSGWDDAVEEEEEEEVQKAESKVSSKGAVRKEAVSRPTVVSSTSSSSFYQQSVPGLDDNDFGEPSVKSTVGGGSSSFNSNSNTTTTITTTSSYLTSKKADDYDPYGPMATRKAKNSLDDQDLGSYTEANEILIGRSTPTPGVSLLSPTSATSMSHRHDHHQHSSSTSRFGGGSNVREVTHTIHTSTSTSSSGGGFFGGGGGGGSLVGDISSLLQEKKSPAPTTSSSTGFGISSDGANLGSDYEPKNPTTATSSSSGQQPPSAVQQKQQALPKSSSWSFGSWVSSAVAAATEKIDQAYETLDPEYSRMKARSPTMSDSTSFASNIGGPGGSGDPDSLSPFKKPGYVVGGSSLALGLASISTPGSSGVSAAIGSGPSATQGQAQAHRYGRSSSEAPIASNNKRDEDSFAEESFASAGTESSDSYGHHGHAHAHHRVSHNNERDQSLSPRLTRKNVR